MEEELVKGMKVLSVKKNENEGRRLFGKIRGKFTQKRHL